MCRDSDPPADTFIRSVISILLLGVSIVLQVCWTVMFVKKWSKNDPTILVRNPSLTLFVNFSVLLFIAGMAYLNVFLGITTNPESCYVYTSLIPYLIAFVGGPYILKTFELHFRFKMVEDIFALRKQAGGVVDEIFSPKRHSASEKRASGTGARTSEIFIPGRLGWFLRYRELFLSWKFQASFAIIWAIASFIPSMVSKFQFTFEKYVGEAFILIIIASALGVLFWKLRGQVDTWGIKRELRNVVGYALLAIVLRFVVFLMPLDRNARKNLGKQELIGFFVFTILLQFMTFESMGRVCLSKKSEVARVIAPEIPEARKGAKAVGEKLLNLLKYPEFFRDFQTYLKKELSAENLNFIEAVLQYEKDLEGIRKYVEDSPDTFKEHVSQMIREVSRIIRVYVDNRGAIPVNLSGMIRAGTLSKLTELKKIARETKDLKTVTDEQKELILTKLTTILDDAKCEILQLLQSDSLNRFMRTEEFLKFEQSNLSWDIVVQKKSISALTGSLVGANLTFQSSGLSGMSSGKDLLASGEYISRTMSPVSLASAKV